MAGSEPKRPKAAEVLAGPRAGEPGVARALHDGESAIRELQRDPRLPRTGAGGDVFYRAADGSVVSLGIGPEGSRLTVVDGLPVWVGP